MTGRVGRILINIHEIVFKNNPYVDDFIDSFEGDIYHDHYRIYDLDNPNVPMVKQMLKFLAV